MTPQAVLGERLVYDEKNQEILGVQGGKYIASFGLPEVPLDTGKKVADGSNDLSGFGLLALMMPIALFGMKESGKCGSVW